MGSPLSVWLWSAALFAHAASAQTLHYVGEWRFLDAGKVQLHLGVSGAKLNLQTAGLADKIYPVRDDYSVSYDRRLCASESLEESHQGKKHREIKVVYGKAQASRVERDLAKNGETVGTAEVGIPACVHDVMGALEMLRRQPAGPGGALALPISDGRKSADVKIEVQEKETIRTPAGVFSTVRHEAMLFNGVIFRRKARLFIWLSDDTRRLPVQIRVQMPFYLGSVTLQLEREEPG